MTKREKYDLGGGLGSGGGSGIVDGEVADAEAGTGAETGVCVTEDEVRLEGSVMVNEARSHSATPPQSLWTGKSD